MKRKNGFTLIELLAIIIILAIIAVITVPIVLDIIDNSKKGAVINSAYGYRDALNKFYMNKVINDKNYDIEDGEYDISYFVNEGLDVSGEKPSAGWVIIENAEVTDFSFKIGDYAVTYVLNTDTIEAVKDGELALTPTQTKVQIYLTSLKQANSTATDIFNLPVEGVSNGDITDGWVALYDGDVIGYSLQVGDKTVSLLNKNDSIENIITSLASTYISGLTTPNSETIVDVTESGKLKGGFIQYVSENSSIVINDYSLKYEIDGMIKYANYDKANNRIVVEDIRHYKPLVVGQTIYIGDQGFYVMAIDNGTATLLANSCLIDDNGTWRQVTGSEKCTKVRFSEICYWKNKVGENLDYPGSYCTSPSQTGCAYIYDIENSDTSNIKPIVDLYVDSLSENAIGRILKLEEAYNLNKTIRSITQYYWIGGAYNASTLWYVNTSGGNINNQGFSNTSGIRPVIEISVSEIQ